MDIAFRGTDQQGVAIKRHLEDQRKQGPEKMPLITDDTEFIHPANSMLQLERTTTSSRAAKV